MAVFGFTARLRLQLGQCVQQLQPVQNFLELPRHGQASSCGSAGKQNLPLFTKNNLRMRFYHKGQSRELSGAVR